MPADPATEDRHLRPLEELNDAEWEALCDGCGRCCLMKWEDATGERVAYTDRPCPQLDLETLRCRHYAERTRVQSDCLVLTPALVRAAPEWLPPSCAYRCVAEGRELPAWHPLHSGDPGSVVDAGFSILGVAEPDRGQPAQIIEWWEEA